MNENENNLAPRSFLSDSLSQSIGSQIATSFPFTHNSGMPLNLHQTPSSSQQMFLPFGLLPSHRMHLLNEAADRQQHFLQDSLPLNLRQTDHINNISALLNSYQSVTGAATAAAAAAVTHRAVTDDRLTFSPQTFSSSVPVPMDNQATALSQRTFSPGAYQANNAGNSANFLDYEYAASQANSASQRAMSSRGSMHETNASERNAFSPENLTNQNGCRQNRIFPAQKSAMLFNCTADNLSGLSRPSSVISGGFDNSTVANLSKKYDGHLAVTQTSKYSGLPDNISQSLKFDSSSNMHGSHIIPEYCRSSVDSESSPFISSPNIQQTMKGCAPSTDPLSLMYNSLSTVSLPIKFVNEPVSDVKKYSTSPEAPQIGQHNMTLSQLEKLISIQAKAEVVKYDRSLMASRFVVPENKLAENHSCVTQLPRVSLSPQHFEHADRLLERRISGDLLKYDEQLETNVSSVVLSSPDECNSKMFDSKTQKVSLCPSQQKHIVSHDETGTTDHQDGIPVSRGGDPQQSCSNGKTCISGMMDDVLDSSEKALLEAEPRCMCPVCDAMVTNTEELKHHMSTVHNVESDAPMGDFLNMNSSSEQDFNGHRMLTVEECDVFSVPADAYTKFSCTDCGAEFRSKEKLIVHVRNHTGENTLLCTICGKSFFKTDKLARHMLVHSGERPYVCRHCGATFTRSDKLRVHLHTRHNDMSFSCRICLETFEDAVALKLHLARRKCKSYHPSENEESERLLKEREALENSFNEIAAQLGDPEIEINLMMNKDKLSAAFDETLHTGGALDPASVVKQVVGDLVPPVIERPMGLFADEASRIESDRLRAKTMHQKKLERIIKRLNKYRTVACPHCHIKLPGAYTLTRHMRIAHSIIKTYQYKKKDRSALQKDRIRIKRPAIIKHCQCIVCGKSFTKLDTLRRHEVTHTGERAFKCRYCDAKYSRSDRLRKHLKTAHVTAAAYPCIKCDEVFENKQELRKHISVHRVRPPKPVVEKARIRGPYKKRRLNLGTSADTAKLPVSNTSLPVNNVDHSEMKSQMKASQFVTRFSESSQQEQQTTQDSISQIAISPCRLAVLKSENVGIVSSSTPSSFVDIMHSEHQTGESVKSEDGEKATENVFRLSSEQLSNALALRNHIKSAFHVKKLFNSTTLRVTQASLVSTDAVESSGEVRQKRKYTRRTETGGKLLRCEKCPKMFYKQRTLDKHLATHLRVKPFECRKCGGRYTRFDSLRSHMKRSHEGRLYSCRKCEMIFEDRAQIREHTATVHNKMVEEDETSASDNEDEEREGNDRGNEKPRVPIFICRVCKTVCDSRVELKKHVAIHKSNNMIKVEDSNDGYDDDNKMNDISKNIADVCANPQIYADAQLSVCDLRETSMHRVGQFKRGRKPTSYYLLLKKDAAPNIKTEPDCDEMNVKQEQCDVSLDNDDNDDGYGDDRAHDDDDVTEMMNQSEEKDAKHWGSEEEDEERSCDSEGTIGMDSDGSDGERITQSNQREISCNQCGLKLSSNDELQNHLRTSHAIKLRVKINCSEIITDDAEGKRAKRSTRRCEKCGKKFKRKKWLYRHMRLHDEMKVKQEVPRMKRQYRKKSVEERLALKATKLDLEQRKVERLSADALDLGGERNSRGLFQCKKCDMTFAMFAKLRRHISTHSSEHPHTCRHCTAVFESSEHLRSHLRTIHRDLYCCSLCGIAFDSRAELKMHKRNHEAQNEVSRLDSKDVPEDMIGEQHCSTGDTNTVGEELSFSGRTSDVFVEKVKNKADSLNEFYEKLKDNVDGGELNLANDIAHEGYERVLIKEESWIEPLSEKKLRGRHGGDKHLSCPICNKGMSSQHSLKRHVTCAHTDERPYVCCDCPKSFSRMDKFRNHLRRHYGFIYPCTVCGETFLRWYHWKKHMLTHTITCELCGFTCVSHSAMLRHIAKHTGQKQFTCSYCSKQFWRNYHLQIHTRIHTGEMPYACDKCGKRFFRSDRLKRHLETHERDCGLLCATCGKSFTTAIALKVHAHIHDTVTPQICHLCDITLATPKDMRRHRKKVHPGETFFLCSVCNKQFLTYDELASHSSEHFDGNPPPPGFNISPDGRVLVKVPRSKQPFLCSICGRQLSSRHALARHQRVHTGERDYTCQYCSQQFTTSFGLRRHVEKHEKSMGKVDAANVKTERISDDENEISTFEEQEIGKSLSQEVPPERSDRLSDDSVRISIERRNSVISNSSSVCEASSSENKDFPSAGLTAQQMGEVKYPKFGNGFLGGELVFAAGETSVIQPALYTTNKDFEMERSHYGNGSVDDGMRQPLDLAKIATSVGIDITEPFS